MITIFTTAKPFCGHSGMIQRNALESWNRLHADAEVILFGDEEGAAEAARELGIRHVAEVERANSSGEKRQDTSSGAEARLVVEYLLSHLSTSSGQALKVRPEVPEQTFGFGAGNAQRPKILRSFFDEAQRIARHELICYVNCDIVLPRDFLHAVNAVDAVHGRFLMVGRRWNVNVEKPLLFGEQGWEQELTERALSVWEQSSGDWIDYFVFRRGFYLGQMPEMVIGRVYWDQWLVWKAREAGAAVVDASAAVMAIHQNHDYGYHPAGKAGVWTDQLARRNYELAGGRWHLRTIDDATHVLGPGGLEENPERRKRAAARILKTAKQAAWMAAVDWTRPVRRRLQEKRGSATESQSHRGETE